METDNELSPPWSPWKDKKAEESPQHLLDTPERHPEFPEQGRFPGAEIYGDLGKHSGRLQLGMPRTQIGVLQINILGSP